MSAEAARPGLSELAYRPGTYATFRRAMIEALSRPGGLTRLTSRRGDDYAITLISLWAAVADVLAFYQERYANEAFLGTATRTESVARLAALLDYRLGPGAAALVRLAFTLEPKKAAALKPGLRVQSLPGPDELPQVFETLEPLAADARLNRLRVFPAQVTATLDKDQKTLTLNRSRGPEIAAGLAAGARVVLFKDSDTTPLEEKIVADVRAEDDRMVIEWTEPVKATAWASGGLAYPFTRTLRLFGHAAPATFMEPSELSPGGAGLGFSTKAKAVQAAQKAAVGDFTLADQSSQALAFGTGSAQALPRIVWKLRALAPAYPRSGNAEETAVENGTSRLCLDGRYDGLAAGAKLLVADTRPGGTKRLVTIQKVDQVHEVHGPLADTVTRVTVSPSVGSLADRRTVVVFELGRRLEPSNARYPERVTGDTVYLPGRLVEDGAGVEVGRQIVAGALANGIVLRPKELEVGRAFVLSDEVSRVVGLLKEPPTITTADANDFCHLVFRLDIDGTLDLGAASAVLTGNVARASHGESVRDEVVGSGDASERFQRFRLARAPVTLVPGAAEGGLESTLELLVDGVRWSEVPTLFGQPPDARVFTGRLADDGKTELRFGDGVQGARLPTGRGNIRASYRVGLGVEARLGADRFTTALDRPPGLLGVTNPLPATGGADPETRDAARRNAPMTVRTFGRAVSLRDFEDLVTASGEVAKAQATWTWDGLGRAIHLTVAAQGGGMFTEDDLRRLTSALTAARDPNHPLRLANHVAVDVVVRAKISVEGDRRRRDVEAAARAALLGAFSFDAQELGRGLGLSDIVRILQDVPGVAFVDVDELGFADSEEADVRRLEPGPVQPRLLVFPARPAETVVGGVRPAELARLGSPTQDATLTASGGLAS